MTRTTPVRESSVNTPARPAPDAGNHRPPCRGCTRECSNYTRCNGKPWRM